MTCNPPDPRTTPVESNLQRFGELEQYSIPVDYRCCQQAHGVSSRVYKINIQKPTNYTVTNGILGSHSEKTSMSLHGSVEQVVGIRPRAYLASSGSRQHDGEY